MSDWYNNLRDIVRNRFMHDDQLEKSRLISPGEIVSEGGSTTFTEQGLSFTYVKLRSNDASRVAALNLTAVTQEGTPVLVARDPKRPHSWQILGPDDTFVRTQMVSPLSNYGTAVHGPNHQTVTEDDPGPDPVNVFQPMMYMLKTVGDGATLTVSTYQYDYSIGEVSRFFAGIDTDLTSSVPGAGLIRKVLLYLDRDTNLLEVVEGTTVLDTGAIPIPLPLMPVDVSGTRSAWVTLANGQSTITTATDIDDARDFMGDDNSAPIPLPTAAGQIIINDDIGGIQWVIPMVDENGSIMTSEFGHIMYLG